MLSYVPETKDFTFLDSGWAVEWRTYTADCRLAGYRDEAGSWLCAGGVEEAPGPVAGKPSARWGTYHNELQHRT